MIFEFISESVKVDLVKCRGESKGLMHVTLDLEHGEVLGQIDIETIVRHYGKEDLLDTIGKYSAVVHFEIEE